MNSESLYIKKQIKAYKKAQKQINNIPINCSFSESQEVKKVCFQEIYILSSNSTPQDLEAPLQNVDNYELSFMRFL